MLFKIQHNIVDIGNYSAPTNQMTDRPEDHSDFQPYVVQSVCKYSFLLLLFVFKYYSCLENDSHQGVHVLTLMSRVIKNFNFLVGGINHNFR